MKMIKLWKMFLVVAMVTSAHVGATEDLIQFQSRQQEQVYRELVAELRCPRCQNQNIADSNALVAKDMRNKTRRMVLEGASKEEVIDYMVERYGEFAHYQPPVKWSTIVLWLLPLAFIFFALFRMKTQSAPVEEEVIAPKDDFQWNEEDEAKLKAKLEQADKLGDKE